MILLDTHAYIWFLSDSEKIPLKTYKIIQEQDIIFVSSISVWETIMLAQKQRIEFNMDVFDWVKKIEMLPFLEFIPIDNEIAVKSTELDGLTTNDPADRFIVATSIVKDMILVTKDKKIKRYSNLKTMWE